MNLWEDKYQKSGFNSQRLYPNEEFLRFIGKNFFCVPKIDRKKIKILELGCGSGANLWVIAKEGFNAFGIDISREGLKLCAKMLKKWGTHATLTHGDIVKLPYDNNHFDAVIDVVSLQHLTFSSHRIVYNEINRVLKPKGLFFSYHLGSKSFSYEQSQGHITDKFTIDNVKNPKAPLHNNGITCFPKEQAVEQLLKKANFENINIENVIKTYKNRTVKIQYLVINAQK